MEFIDNKSKLFYNINLHQILILFFFSRYHGLMTSRRHAPVTTMSSCTMKRATLPSARPSVTVKTQAVSSLWLLWYLTIQESTLDPGSTLNFWLPSLQHLFPMQLSLPSLNC